MFPYSAETLQRLKEAGWYEGRQIDPKPFVTSLTERGFEVNEAAIRFFAEFGGLTVRYPSRTAEENREDICLDVRQVYAFLVNIQHRSNQLGVPVCLIGQFYVNYVELIMTPDGTVYGSSDSNLAKYGNSGAEAIETLCADLEPENVSFDEEQDDETQEEQDARMIAEQNKLSKYWHEKHPEYGPYVPLTLPNTKPTP